MCRRTASGVSLTETASASGPGPWSAAAAGSPVLPRDVRRTSRRNAPATRNLRAFFWHGAGSGRFGRMPAVFSGTHTSTCSADCRMSDRLCTRRANCSGAELLGSGGAPVGKNSPQGQVRKEKACCGGALRREWGIPPQSRPPGARDAQRRRLWPPRRDDSRAPYRASLPASIFSVDAQKLRRTPLVPADNLEGLEDVAPIDLLAISRRRFLSRLPTPKSRVSWIVVSVRSARPSLWYCLMRERL